MTTPSHALERPRVAVAYRGMRLPSTVRVVRVHADGTNSPLLPRFDLRLHSPDGFEWGYCGSGPAQLALAMLSDWCAGAELFAGDPARGLAFALDHYQAWKWHTIARLTGDTWELPTSHLADWVQTTLVTEAQDAGSAFPKGGAA